MGGRHAFTSKYRPSSLMPARTCLPSGLCSVPVGKESTGAGVESRAIAAGREDVLVDGVALNSFLFLSVENAANTTDTPSGCLDSISGVAAGSDVLMLLFKTRTGFDSLPLVPLKSRRRREPMPEGTDVACLLSTLGVKSSENKETAGATGVFSSLVRSVVNLTVSGHTFLEVATMSTTWLPQSPQVSTPLMVSVKFTGPHSLHLKDAGSCVKCDNIGVAIEAMAFGRLEKGVARWRFMLRGESGNMVLLLLMVFLCFASVALVGISFVPDQEIEEIKKKSTFPGFNIKNPIDTSIPGIETRYEYFNIKYNNFPDLGDFNKNSRKETISTIFAKREYR